MKNLGRIALGLALLLLAACAQPITAGQYYPIPVEEQQITHDGAAGGGGGGGRN